MFVYLSPSNFWFTTDKRWLTKQLHSELPALESVTSRNMDRWLGGLLCPAMAIWEDSANMPQNIEVSCQ